MERRWLQRERVRAETIERQSWRRRFVYSLLLRGFLVVMVVLVGLTKSSVEVVGCLLEGGGAAGGAVSRERGWFCGLLWGTSYYCTALL